MTASQDMSRLSQLRDIADLKADQALAALARAEQEKRTLEGLVSSIDDEIQRILCDAAHPTMAMIAFKFADMKRGQRSALIAKLAQAEKRLRAVKRAARQEEGRRIALGKILG